MPDYVTVSYSRGRVTLPASSVEALLDDLGNFASAAGIVQAFESAGPGAPVELERDDVAVLVLLIDAWAERVPVDDLPGRLWELRCALHDELSDSAGA